MIGQSELAPDRSDLSWISKYNLPPLPPLGPLSLELRHVLDADQHLFQQYFKRLNDFNKPYDNVPANSIDAGRLGRSSKVVLRVAN